MNKKAPTKTDLTDGQKVVYDWVKNFIDVSGYPPTRHEIRIGVGFVSTNGVQYHLDALQSKGWISVTPRIARSIRIL